VDNPLALCALLVAVGLAGWWSLRGNQVVRRTISVLLCLVLAGLAAQSSGLMAQVSSAFTNPEGETLPISISPITAGGFKGFQPADFSNNSGVALRIAAIAQPNFSQCFAIQPAHTLLPPGPPTPSPHPACGTGALLAGGATCRVDVEAICRGLYIPGTTLSAASPGTGGVGGGTTVTLTGTGLGAATSVAFGGVPAVSMSVVNATTVTAVTPAHAAGTVDIVVMTPSASALLAGGFTYLPAPVLTAASPGSGPVSGGATVILSGSGLAGATGVTFDGVPAASFTVNSATSITAVTPAHAAGAVDIAVTSPAGAAQLAGGYTYVAPGALTSITPSAGTASGGTSVTLGGSGLTGTTSVTFGGVPAASFVVNSAASVTAVTPAHAPGAVDVVVTTPGGSATALNGYTYATATTLTGANPFSGTASGGASVTLTGTGLTGATSVTFGGVPATSVNVVSSTTLTAVTPAHPVGLADVVVTTPNGTATLTYGYHYLATAVGQQSRGGVIAALGADNLIAATADQSAGVEWGGVGILIGPAAQSFTDGATNTAAIEAELGPWVYAARVCSTYQVDSQGNSPCQAGNACYSNWFLPAPAQLAALHVSRAAVGGFAANGEYWSSAESTHMSARSTLFFNTPQTSAPLKNFSARVRCVSSFTP
jgi:hypothetical protein